MCMLTSCVVQLEAVPLPEQSHNRRSPLTLHQSQAAPTTGSPTSAACAWRESRPQTQCGGTRLEAATARNSKARTVPARSPTCASCQWTPACCKATTPTLSAPSNTTRQRHRRHLPARTNDTCLWLVRSLLLIMARPTLTVSYMLYKTTSHPCRSTCTGHTPPCSWGFVSFHPCSSVRDHSANIPPCSVHRVAKHPDESVSLIYKFCYYCNGTKMRLA